MTAYGLAVLMMLGWQDEAGQDRQPTMELIELDITAAPLPKPALRYRLIPRYIEKSSGNAALIYLRCFQAIVELEQGVDGGNLSENVDRLLLLSYDQLRENKEARELVGTFTSIFAELAIAARRESADWELLLREQEDILAIRMLPIVPTRNAGRMLCLKARLELADGRFEDATNTLTVGIAMCRHLGSEPLLITYLLSKAVLDQLLSVAESAMTVPTSPNLFWALTSLPNPVIEFEPAASCEVDNLYYPFQELLPQSRQQLSNEAFDLAFRKFLKKAAAWEELMGAADSGPLSASTPEQVLDQCLPHGRERLKARGLSDAAIDAMPKSKIAILDAFETFDAMCDDFAKTNGLPYWQAAPLLKATAQRCQDVGVKGSPLTRCILHSPPAWKEYRRAAMYTERQLAMIRCIAALRAYAADNAGKLPVKMEEIDLPLPRDPASGQPFDYSLGADGVGLLKSNPAVEETSSRVYRLRIK